MYTYWSSIPTGDCSVPLEHVTLTLRTAACVAALSLVPCTSSAGLPDAGACSTVAVSYSHGSARGVHTWPSK